MPHDDKPADIDPLAKDIIRRKARSLIRRGGFSRSDLPDLEQDLSLHLLKQTPTFDPQQADWPVFVAAVLTAWGANLLRARYAAKRDYRRTRLLHARAESGEGDSPEPMERLHRPEQDPRLGHRCLSDQEQAERRMDLREALERLPAKLRCLAERLQHITIAELARELGMPPSSLYELIKRIRRRFERAGLTKNH